MVSKIEDVLRKKYASSAPVIFSVPHIPEAICIARLPLDKDCICGPKNGLNEIIVDTKCGSSILRGAHLYAPGVLAMKSGTKTGDEVNVYADWEGKCRKGTNEVYDSDKKIFLGIGTVRMARFQLFRDSLDPSGVAVEMQSTISGVPSIGDLSSLDVLLQNFPSMVCSRVLNPLAGETILDMCSAPGNKLTHLVELMNDEGIVIALDKSACKVEIVKEKIIERAITSVKCFAFDSTKAWRQNTEPRNIDEPPFQSETFDRILLDAPCSALGNRPLLRSDINTKMLLSFPKIQKRLFRSAVELLKVGGVLVYSTCTVTEDENEGLVRWAVDTFPNMELVKSDPIFGSPGLENSNLTDIERNFVQRFGPGCGDRFDSVGFFIAKFRKREIN